MECEGHPNVTHRDAVATVAVAAGELRCHAQRLARDIGAVGAGVTRFVVPPGGRTTPAHVHGDEEELVYVLAGGGLSWQDGRTHAIADGDVLLHRVHAEAHTLIAGPDGLDVLVFGPASATNLTWLPHAGVMRVGPRWLPAEVADPYAAEVAAGPLPMPACGPEPTRPATVAHRDDVAAERYDRPGYEGVERRLGEHLGARSTGLRHTWIAPGALSCPPHWHSAEEELFVVLDGDGHALLGDDEVPLRAGSVLARPPGTTVAHALRGGPQGMTYLSWGTRVPADVVHYPRSGKIAIAGQCFRVEPVDYWAGE